MRGNCSQNVNFTKFIFIFRTENKTVMTILTQNDVKFQTLAVSQKSGDCRKHRPGCTCTMKLGQKLHCFSRHMNIHADLSVSTKMLPR